MAFKFLVIVCMLIGYCDAIKLRHLQPEKQMKDRLDGRLDERWMLFKRTHNKTYVNLTEEVVRSSLNNCSMWSLNNVYRYRTLLKRLNQLFFDNLFVDIYLFDMLYFHIIE